MKVVLVMRLDRHVAVLLFYFLAQGSRIDGRGSTHCNLLFLTKVVGY